MDQRTFSSLQADDCHMDPSSLLIEAKSLILYNDNHGLLIISMGSVKIVVHNLPRSEAVYANRNHYSSHEKVMSFNNIMSL